MSSTQVEKEFALRNLVGIYGHTAVAAEARSHLCVIARNDELSIMPLVVQCVQQHVLLHIEDRIFIEPNASTTK